MSQFVDTMLASFPPCNPPPEPIVQFFHWIEQQGLHRVDINGGPYALVDPDADSSSVTIEPVDLSASRDWTHSDDPAVYERLALFCRTGGDGSYAALWRDDNGQQHIVHLGAGSGSILLGIMVASPLDFLRALAIGYDELCWDEIHELTPQEAFLEENPDYEDEPDSFDPPKPPLALRDWVTRTFGVSIPERASEVLKAMPSMNEDSSDPFHRWVMGRSA
jgi:hypothetical protein